MAKKDPQDKSQSREGFWAGFSGKRAQTPLEADAESGSPEGEVAVSMGPGDWGPVRASLKKSLSAPAKRRARPARAWTASRAAEEMDLEWTAQDEQRLRERETPEPLPARQTEWARMLQRAQRPAARRFSPSLWSLVRALFQRPPQEPPTGQ